ncbi:MAG: hypothetical protein ACFE9R_11795, partial [Candidatus Hermodarchaeota archaeon]
RLPSALAGMGLVLLIPIFTRIIANAIRRENNYFNITKAIIKYIPLEMAFAILLYQTLGFVGFADPRLPQLGVTLYWSLGSFSYWGARIWPGLFLLLICLGLILLHEGLQAPASSRILSEEPSTRLLKKIKTKLKKRKSVQNTLNEQPLDYKSKADTAKDEPQNS